MRYFAHSGSDSSDARSDWQPLNAHLAGVAREARSRALGISVGGHPVEPEAFAAGLLHDLGKYRSGFQRMLEGLPVPRPKTFHKQAGAAKAASAKNPPVAFAVAGHHGGLPNLADLKSLINGEAGREEAERLWPVALADCPELATLDLAPATIRDLYVGDLFTRVVFSCLVDADWSDTAEAERTRKGWPIEPEPPALDPGARLEEVLASIQRKSTGCKSETIREIRREILDACLRAAEASPGLFSLTVPTGGGKTLSGLAFALSHARKNRLRRIIYVAPYLTILDQNAREIRAALQGGADGRVVFEHHGLTDFAGDPDYADPDHDRARRAENWDAPVIVTTNVQFFESLFSNQPGRCRKLHNIAGSVILLDECQTIPPSLLAPTCAMLGQLANDLGCTLVFCTATQPTFDHPELLKRGVGLTGVTEIIPDPPNLFARLRRVTIDWPKPDESLDWAQVAEQMTRAPDENARSAALCVVNSRRAARELFKALETVADPGDVFHLSTRMYPKHRLAVIDHLKQRLDEGRRCVLVSTQLIESGVDISFPFVMREIGPLEAMIQAAGRCNREGLLNRADGSPGGRVVVFRARAAVEEPRQYYPSDLWYRLGRSKVEDDFLRAGREPRIDDPADVKEYYQMLLSSGELDKPGIQSHRQALNFADVSREYRLIQDAGEPVVVASCEHTGEIASLLDQARLQPTRANYRKLAPFQVNLRESEMGDPSVNEEAPGLWVWRGRYHEKLGLTIHEEDFSWGV